MSTPAIPVLEVRLPDSYRQERLYIVDVVFTSFAGLAYSVSFDPTLRWVEIGRADSQQILKVADCFFQTPEGQWLNSASVPDGFAALMMMAQDYPPLGRRVPALFYDELPTLDVPLDVFGASFFLLSRYEEACSTTLDEHQRFPGSASLLAKAGLLEVPLVDIYVEIFLAALSEYFPGINVKKTPATVAISFDVDAPFRFLFDGPSAIIRHAGAEVLLYKNPLAALRAPLQYYQVRQGRETADPYYRFDDIFTELRGLSMQACFYFLAGRHHRYDGDYDIHHPALLRLLRRVLDEGHDVGLHGSYTSYRSSERLAQECLALEAALTEVGQTAPIVSRGRQHFLRWSAEETWACLEAAGISEDNSLGYADLLGFRCGTFKRFPVFDLLRKRRLKLYAQPLHLMDATVFGYMQLSDDEIVGKLTRLVDLVNHYGGCLSLLWHNNRLVSRREWAVFTRCLRLLKSQLLSGSLTNC